jgi:3-oxoacyl-[acyl-carrier-protein] synthase-3
MTLYSSLIAGVGAYLPARAVPNAALASYVETSDDWIVERTGIRQRHIAGPTESTATLAAQAARAAIANAGLTAHDIDAIILATATPDHTFPATATEVQALLGIRHGFAFDVQAVCSGFVYALTVADGLLARGQARAALVIGAECFSRILDWSDRGTCVLFGDGAGALVLKAVPQVEAAGRGILSAYLRSDGRQRDLLYVDGGPGGSGSVGKLRMQGNQVFRHAVANIAEAIEETVARAGLSVAEVDWFVPHQANRRILDGVARRLAIPEHKVVTTVDRHGNTSAASVPLAFSVAHADGRIKPGDLVLFEAMGGGFTWGAALVRL